MSTAQQVPKITYEPMHLPKRNRLDVGAPLRWLRAGFDYWQDNPLPSLAYGLVFACIGAAITLLGMSQPQFVFTFWSGFLLVGPFFAMGLYRIAQQSDLGEQIRFTRCMRVLGGQRALVGVFTVILALVMIAWIRISTLAVALYVGNVASPSAIMSTLTSPEGLGFVATLFGIGAVFAVGMFLLTAWSLPMVIDGRGDVGTAIAASVKAIVEQPAPMLLWAALVAGLTLLGMATLFIGFVVIFPLLGYATWAGYKELFGSR
jgi:uncharacterized membrane protein